MAAALLRFAATGDAPRPPSAEAAEALANQAHAQGLAGLLHERVHADPTWPEATRARLRVLHQAALRRGVRQLDLLERARTVLAARGLRSLPLKGAAVAERLYRSVAERPMADVDLLALDDAAGALQLLMADGLTLLESADHATALLDPRSGEVLELHHAVASCPSLHPLDTHGLWARSVPVTGQVQRSPGQEDLLILLAQHAAFQHGFVLTLVQWLDIARLLGAPGLELPRLREIARAAQAEHALAGTLHVVARLMAAPVPGEWIGRARDTLPGTLRAWLDRRLARGACVAPARPALAWARWLLASGRRRLLVRETLRWGEFVATRSGRWQRLPALARRVAHVAWHG